MAYRSGSARTTIKIVRTDISSRPVLAEGERSAAVAFKKYANAAEAAKLTGTEIKLGNLYWEVVGIEVDSSNLFFPVLTINVRRSDAERARLGLTS